MATKIKSPLGEIRSNNTSFFHNFANSTRARNMISSLTEDQDKIEKEQISFYKSLYTKNSLREAWFENLKGKAISSQNAA